MKNKSIFIYVNQGFSARYLLRSSVLQTLVKNSSHVVILSHNGDEKVFKDSYKSDNVKVKKFENEKFGSSQYAKTVSSIDHWLGKILGKIDIEKTLVLK